jgi:hypothetical protein
MSTERLSRQQVVLDCYSHQLETLVSSYGILHAEALGSFGNKQAQTTSDMDIWLTVDPAVVFDLDSLHHLSSFEWQIRRSLAIGTEYTDVGRHRASIFTPQEVDYYNLAFLFRVAYPRILGHYLDLVGSSDTTLPRASPLDRASDFVVSMEEFSQNYSSSLSSSSKPTEPRKWIRRLAHELYFYQSNLRFSNNQDLDAYICQTWPDGYDSVVKSAQAFITPLKDLLPPIVYQQRRLAHSLAWTLEKVRWEILDCLDDPAHFDNWRFGLARHFGFNPYRLGELVLATSCQIGNSPQAQELSSQIISLTDKNTTLDCLPTFHHSLSAWVEASFSHLFTPNFDSADSFYSCPDIAPQFSRQFPHSVILKY